MRYGLMEQVRELLPLPPDWRVVRSIPAPAAGMMTYGRGLLWVHDPSEHAAIAVSPEDGAIVKALKLPGEKAEGIGWWDDSLATAGEKLRQVDADTGQVKREIAVKQSVEPKGIAQVDGKV